MRSTAPTRIIESQLSTIMCYAEAGWVSLWTFAGCCPCLSVGAFLDVMLIVAQYYNETFKRTALEFASGVILSLSAALRAGSTKGLTPVGKEILHCAGPEPFGYAQDRLAEGFSMTQLVVVLAAFWLLHKEVSFCINIIRIPCALRTSQV